MYIEKQFTKSDIEHYLYLLAKEYRKRNRKAKHVELILVGGASVIVNYGFRDITTDIDAMILADSVMKEAIMAVAEKENIPDGWLNADFQKSGSFSDSLIRYSSYYKTYANIMEVRTVKDEYLIAMKLVAGRNYKRDLSDIIGIVKYTREAGGEISFESIDKAMTDLYGGWENVEDYSRRLLFRVLTDPSSTELYSETIEEENNNKILRLEDLKRK
jgi:predicted nucleotidyltransferase